MPCCSFTGRARPGASGDPEIITHPKPTSSSSFFFFSPGTPDCPFPWSDDVSYFLPLLALKAQFPLPPPKKKDSSPTFLPFLGGVLRR